MNEEEIIKGLLSVATGKIPHIYSGLCPDEMEGPNVRDPYCSACRLLVKADDFLSDAGRIGREKNKEAA